MTAAISSRVTAPSSNSTRTTGQPLAVSRNWYPMTLTESRSSSAAASAFGLAGDTRPSTWNSSVTAAAWERPAPAHESARASSPVDAAFRIGATRYALSFRSFEDSHRSPSLSTNTILMGASFTALSLKVNNGSSAMPEDSRNRLTRSSP